MLESNTVEINKLRKEQTILANKIDSLILEDYITFKPEVKKRLGKIWKFPFWVDIQYRYQYRVWVPDIYYINAYNTYGRDLFTDCQDIEFDLKDVFPDIKINLKERKPDTLADIRVFEMDEKGNIVELDNPLKDKYLIIGGSKYLTTTENI